MTSRHLSSSKYEDIKSVYDYFIDFNINLFLCRHLLTSSVLLFNSPRGSARIMIVFSERHRSHILEPFLYGIARVTMLQTILCSMFSVFNFQINFDNSVSCLYFSCRNDFVWLLYRSLNSPSHDP